MKIFILILLLKYSDYTILPASNANSKFNENAFYDLREKSNIRGNYKDVASQNNGALLSSARANVFIVPNLENCPLRNLLYFKDPIYQEGHIAVTMHGQIIVEFLQTYEINRIRFWMYEVDARITDIQIFVVGSDRISEKIIFDGLAQPKVITIKFPDQLVSKVRFYNKGGSNISQYMSIIKIQAYYGF